MQIIRRNIRDLLFSFTKNNKLDFFQKISYLSQLTVWFNNTLLISLITIGLASFKLNGFFIPDSLVAMTLLLVGLFIISKVFIYFWALRKKEELSWRQASGAFFSNLSLNWPMATAWWKCLFSPEGSFWRTSKYPHKLVMSDRIQTVKWELAFFASFLFLGLVFLIQQEFLISSLLITQAFFIYLPPLVAIIKYK